MELTGKDFTRKNYLRFPRFDLFRADTMFCALASLFRWRSTAFLASSSSIEKRSLTLSQSLVLAQCANISLSRSLSSLDGFGRPGGGAS